jgi:hypothetical protein
MLRALSEGWRRVSECGSRAELSGHQRLFAGQRGGDDGWTSRQGRTGPGKVLQQRYPWGSGERPVGGFLSHDSASGTPNETPNRVHLRPEGYAPPWKVHHSPADSPRWRLFLVTRGSDDDGHLWWIRLPSGHRHRYEPRRYLLA